MRWEGYTRGCPGGAGGGCDKDTWYTCMKLPKNKRYFKN